MANQILLKRASGSDPVASDLVIGEIAIRTDSGKLFTKKDNGTVAEISGSGGSGNNFFINTLSSSSGSGGGSATFNGTATRFELSNPPNLAAQLLVSINGVIQKPNTGTSPSEGFAVDGNDIIFSSAPASGADFFIVTYASLSLAEPSDNTVTSAKIVDGAIVNADINANAAIDGSKINPDFGSQNLVIADKIIHSGDTNTAIRFAGNDQFSVQTGGSTRFSITDSQIQHSLNTQIAGTLTMAHTNGNFIVNNNAGTNVFTVNSSTGNVNTVGNITVSGTVDGRDVATDGTKLDGIAVGATNVTNTNQLTNGAGFITATLTNEQVQDIVGGMVTGNTESGITVTYQDGDGTLDFSVASQTDQNFTTTLKNKLDGIATGATNVTNTNQLTNGAGFLTSVGTSNISDNAVTMAKLQDLDQNRIFGRIASGSGNPTALTAANVRSMINVEDGATADQTASEILTLIKTVDGSGSGLDADTLDGLNAATTGNSARIVRTNSSGYIFANFFNTTPNTVSSGITQICVETGNDGYIRHGTAAAVRTFINVENGATADQSASEILTLLKTVDGAGSGLAADTLDGVSSTQFLRSDTADTASGDITFAGGAGAVTIEANSDIRLSSNSSSWSGESVKLQHFGNRLYIQGGSDGIRLRGSDGNDDWHIENTGHFIPAVDSQVDIGESGTRVRDGYFDDVFAHRIGIGTTNIGAYNGNFDNFVIRGSGNTGMTISTDDNSFGQIAFGNAEDTHVSGAIQYRNSDNILELRAGESNGAVIFSTVSNTERMRINSSGNLGIGTTSPTLLKGDGGRLIHLAGADNPEIVLERTTSGTEAKASIRITDNEDFIIAVKDGSASAIDALTIDSSTGNVGIGTTSPSSLLELRQSSASHQIVSINRANSNTAALYLGNDSSQNALISSNNSELVFGKDFSGTFTELMRLDASGRLGIGTSDPSVTLDIEATTPTIRLTDSDASGTPESEIRGGGGDLVLSADRDNEKSNTIIGFNIDGSEQMRITEDGVDVQGNIIIASSNNAPKITFDENGANDPKAEIQMDQLSGSSGNLLVKVESNGNLFTHTTFHSNSALFCTGVFNSTTGSGANQVSVDSSGKLRRITSSQRYKTDIETLEDKYADAILEARPVWYKSLCEDDNKDHGHWGFVAEEIEKIDPRLCAYKTSETVIEDGKTIEKKLDTPIIESVQYERFIPHLLNLIKRQDTKIKLLETKVKALEVN